MTALYSLTEQLRELQALADSDTDIPEDVLRETLEGLQGALEVKATNVARFVRNQESLADAIEGAAKQMRERAARVRRRTDSMRQYLLANMALAGISRIENAELVLAIRKNPPSVVIDDAAQIPAEYMREPEPPPPPAPDKKRIGDALKAGTAVPGCRIEQGQRLEIKA